MVYANEVKERFANFSPPVIYDEFYFLNENISQTHKQNIYLSLGSTKNYITYDLNQELISFFNERDIDYRSAVHILKYKDINDYVQKLNKK